MPEKASSLKSGLVLYMVQLLAEARRVGAILQYLEISDNGETL
jgi:hypothetical protein